MDVERTIEFLLKNQARMDAKFAKAEQRLLRLNSALWRPSGDSTA